MDNAEFLLGTVIAVSNANGIRIQIDGQDEPMTKYYKMMLTGADAPSVNDRVIVMKQSGTYIILGKIGTPSQTGLITTDTISEIATAASGFTITWGSYAQFGKVAMCSLLIRADDAVSTSSYVTLATINAGKRPINYIAINCTRSTYAFLDDTGEIKVSATVSAGAVYTLSATYLLP